MDNSIQSDNAITYDYSGRMKYNPEFHAKQGTAWTTFDQQYLIDNYVDLGPETVSFALERTIRTIMTRAWDLRKKGLMPKATNMKYHKRIKPTTLDDKAAA